MHTHAHAYRCYLSRLLAAAVTCLALLVSVSSMSAQVCRPGGCSELKIYNCTGTGLLISFELCCDGVLVRTDYKPISGTHCPPNDPAYFDFDGCTLTGNFSIISPGAYPVEVHYDPSTCYARIY